MYYVYILMRPVDFNYINIYIESWLLKHHRKIINRDFKIIDFIAIISTRLLVLVYR